MSALIALLATASLAADNPAPALPPEVRAVIEAAVASGDRQAVATVARFSERAYPAAAAEIRAIEHDFTAAAAARDAEAAEVRRDRLAHAGMLEEWDGQIEFGGTRSTGSTDSLGLYAAVTARRAGLHWSHQFNARAEIQETNGRRSVERVSAQWQPRRALDEHLYLFGLAQYERDPFIGFGNRYTAGLGAGYSLLDRPALRVEVEGGPAFRRTDARDHPDFSALAARASLGFTWKLTPTLELKQNGALFLAEQNGSAQSVSALDAALIGPLRMRLSYELRFERDILRDTRTVDTTSRATLVYGF